MRSGSSFRVAPILWDTHTSKERSGYLLATSPGDTMGSTKTVNMPKRLPASTSVKRRSPTMATRSAGSPIVPVFCTLLPGGRFRLVFEPPGSVLTGDPADAVATFLGRLESWIAREPA